MIDLVSDTVTRPSPAMLDAMLAAPLGDDVLCEDPSVNALEEKTADMFGMEAGLFCASGTMTNQIALNVHTRPGDSVICHELAHIYLYEGGGMMANSGLSVRLVGSHDGLMTDTEVDDAIDTSTNVHNAITRVVALENTSNRGGGRCYDMETIRSIGAVTKQQGLAYHLDGARVFNALVARDQNPSDYGNEFDSISVCFSKSLGCPIGSVLLGSRELIFEARRLRKRLGGGWRQAGMLAAAAVYALDQNIERLHEDHARARELYNCIRELDWVHRVTDPETNIVLMETATEKAAAQIQYQLAERGLRIQHMGKNRLRAVTHLDVSDADIDRACALLRSLEVKL